MATSHDLFWSPVTLVSFCSSHLIVISFIVFLYLIVLLRGHLSSFLPKMNLYVSQLNKRSAVHAVPVMFLGDILSSFLVKKNYVFFLQLNKRSAVHAVPVISTPAVATAGYAVGASGDVFAVFFYTFLLDFFLLLLSPIFILQ